MFSIEGRSLIRIFLAGATKDAAVYEMSVEQAQMKKMWIDLALSKFLKIFGGVGGMLYLCNRLA